MSNLTPNCPCGRENCAHCLKADYVNGSPNYQSRGARLLRSITFNNPNPPITEIPAFDNVACWHLINGRMCGAPAVSGLDMSDESGTWRFLTCATHREADIRAARRASASGASTLNRVVTL